MGEKIISPLAKGGMPNIHLGLNLLIDRSHSESQKSRLVMVT